ncbi:MAG: hypothetical protein R3C52_13110 [Hyphomonadaceae bacterium]
MTEGEIIEQLVEFQNILLLGVSLFITIVSAYMVSLYTFLANAAFLARFFAFVFLTMTVAFLIAFFFGSSFVQSGLVEALTDLERDPNVSVSAAGRSIIANARSGVDDLIRFAVLASAIAFYVGLSLLTLWTGWRKIPAQASA